LSFSGSEFDPLTERFRPQTLDDLVGQNHLFGERGILRRALEEGKLFSCILYGPPGCGKTSFARVLQKKYGWNFLYFSASSGSVAELKKLLTKRAGGTAFGGKLVLFVDEIHRLNKAQQDVFLPYLESKDLILIGSTTENPSFEINPALLSRCRVLVFKPLSREDIKTILEKALKEDKVLSSYGIRVDKKVLDEISLMSNGDARFALSTLELVVEFDYAEGKTEVDTGILEQLVASAGHKKRSSIDEEHYNLASAFIKSMRGSDPDAALYYMVRMLEEGEDPPFIARRMVILASEDVGLADPQALLIAVAAAHAVEYVGMPECILNLAEAAIYLSVAPKSNAVYVAIGKAKEFIKEHPDIEIPLKLRNPVTKLMESWGYGNGYSYPHKYGGFVQTSYMPKGFENIVFYHPTGNGHEDEILKRLEFLWRGIKIYNSGGDER